MSITEGPWKLQKSSNGPLLLVRNCDQSHLGISPDADARAISKVPEMVGLLRSCVDQQGSVNIEEMQRCHAILDYIDSGRGG